MAWFNVEALERFVVRTRYKVEADDKREAERICRDGETGYDSHTIEEGDEQWLETVSVEEI